MKKLQNLLGVVIEPNSEISLCQCIKTTFSPKKTIPEHTENFCIIFTLGGEGVKRTRCGEGNIFRLCYLKGGEPYLKSKNRNINMNTAVQREREFLCNFPM